MRLRILELLFVTAVVAFACLALKRSDEVMEVLFFSFTLLVVVASLLLAIGRTDGARAYWLAFFLCSSGYLAFAHLPDHDELTPRHDGPELTTQLLRVSYNWIHGERFRTFLSPPPPPLDADKAVGGGFFLVPDRPSALAQFEGVPVELRDDGAEVGDMGGDVELPMPGDETYIEPLSLIAGGGQRIVSTGTSESFMRIGHAFWALLIGWIAGHCTQLIYEQSRRERAGTGRNPRAAAAGEAE